MWMKLLQPTYKLSTRDWQEKKKNTATSNIKMILIDLEIDLSDTVDLIWRNILQLNSTTT